LAAKILVKESLAHVLPTFWQESVRKRDRHALAAKTLGTNQTITTTIWATNFLAEQLGEPNQTHPICFGGRCALEDAKRVVIEAVINLAPCFDLRGNVTLWRQTRVRGVRDPEAKRKGSSSLFPPCARAVRVRTQPDAPDPPPRNARFQLPTRTSDREPGRRPPTNLSTRPALFYRLCVRSRWILLLWQWHGYTRESTGVACETSVVIFYLLN
jgi:hypothetical protein